MFYMENNLDVCDCHAHCYETSQIIKQIRVIVLHGNRGMMARCYHWMTDLSSYPLWFSSTAAREKETICLSWSCRNKKKSNKGSHISRRHQLEEMDHRMKHQFTHAVCSQCWGQFCWHMCSPGCRVWRPNKRLLHSKHGEVPATRSTKFKEQKGQPPKYQRWIAG